MALNLEIGSGLAFPKTSKAGNVYYEGEANLNGQRIKVVLGIISYSQLIPNALMYLFCINRRHFGK